MLGGNEYFTWLVSFGPYSLYVDSTQISVIPSCHVRGEPGEGHWRHSSRQGPHSKISFVMWVREADFASQRPECKTLVGLFVCTLCGLFWILSHQVPTPTLNWAWDLRPLIISASAVLRPCASLGILFRKIACSCENFRSRS